MFKQMKEVRGARRVLNLVALVIMLVAGAGYGVTVWQARELVRGQIADAEFQNTHFGRNLDIYCGEVSGINGFGMRTPYIQFILDGSEVRTAGMTRDRLALNDFYNQWTFKCESSLF